MFCYCVITRYNTVKVKMLEGQGKSLQVRAVLTFPAEDIVSFNAREAYMQQKYLG